MRLVFLGTAAAYPTPDRGLACTCLVTDHGEIVMFDAGEGAQIAYTRAGLGWNKPMRLLVTHMHGDHCLGIPGLLLTMGMHGRTEPVEIAGPAGITEYVRANARVLRLGLPFELTVREVGEGRNVAAGRGYAVHACRADHTVPALSYLFAEDDRPGTFFPGRAEGLGVPKGPLWNRLQRGHSVQGKGGRTVRPEDVLGTGRAGRTVGYSGDTRPARRLVEFFRSVDCLVFDSTFADEHAERAEQTGHSTASGAGRLARDAGARRLMLTHFSSRYPDAAALAAEAGRLHGSVTAARDMMEIEVEWPGGEEA